jgi:hypothetical protein
MDVVLTFFKNYNLDIGCHQCHDLHAEIRENID